MNCGVVLMEAAGNSGLHPIQELHRTEDGGHVCEACFFQDGYDRDGQTIAGQGLARSASAPELGERLAAAETREHIRKLCSIFGVSRERGMTKGETAEKLARERPEVVAKELVKKP